MNYLAFNTFKHWIGVYYSMSWLDFLGDTLSVPPYSDLESVVGFEVIDIGIDQPTLTIIETAQNHKADVIGLSSVMTTTMPYQKEVIDTLTEMGLRDKFMVLVGGGPVSEKWADEIGADGYGDTAMDAVNIAKNLLSKKQ